MVGNDRLHIKKRKPVDFYYNVSRKISLLKSNLYYSLFFGFFSVFKDRILPIKIACQISSAALKWYKPKTLFHCNNQLGPLRFSRIEIITLLVVPNTSEIWWKRCLLSLEKGTFGSNCNICWLAETQDAPLTQRSNKIRFTNYNLIQCNWLFHR